MTITGWRTSTYCDAGNGCVEAGDFRSSSWSGGGECAEVGSCVCGIAVRDSKLGASSPVLTFSAGGWERFVSRVRDDAGAA